MKQTIFIIFTLLSLTTFSQNNYDTSKIAVISLDTTQHWSWHLKSNKSTDLTIVELNRVASILNICIAENNNNGKPTNSFGKYIRIHSFKRQFISSINDKGGKIIWVNCFSDDSEANWSEGLNWKKEVIVVHDGGVGGGLFNVKINLTAKTYSDLYVNGM